VTAQTKAAVPAEKTFRTIPADVGQYTEATARQITAELNKITDQLGQKFEEWQNLLVESYQRRAWAVLGYETWGAFLDAVVPALRQLRLGRSDRRELVAMLADAGMSMRAIGSALGIGVGTVARDRSAGVPNGTPDEADPEAIESEQTGPGVVNAETVDDEPEDDLKLRKVTGLDGRTCSIEPRDVPPPQPRRSPLSAAFSEAASKLNEVVQRLVRLTEDDRFRGHAAELNASSCRGDLDRAQQSIGRVLNALWDAGVQPQVDVLLAADGGSA
jgi:hypothetical protein